MALSGRCADGPLRSYAGTVGMLSAKSPAVVGAVKESGGHAATPVGNGPCGGGVSKAQGELCAGRGGRGSEWPRLEAPRATIHWEDTPGPYREAAGNGNGGRGQGVSFKGR